MLGRRPPAERENCGWTAVSGCSWAWSLPHTLRPVDVNDDALAESDVLVGFDDDLAGEATRLADRVRGLLTGLHPALKRVIGPKIAHSAVLEILSRCGDPAGIGKAGRRKLVSIATKHAPRMGRNWSPRSWPRSTSRPSPSRHRRGRHRASQAHRKPENRWNNERSSPSRWRRSSMRALVPGS
jgi:hypothetical protein